MNSKIICLIGILIFKYSVSFSQVTFDGITMLGNGIENQWLFDKEWSNKNKIGSIHGGWENKYFRPSKNTRWIFDEKSKYWVRTDLKYFDKVYATRREMISPNKDKKRMYFEYYFIVDIPGVRNEKYRDFINSGETMIKKYEYTYTSLIDKFGQEDQNDDYKIYDGINTSKVMAINNGDAIVDRAWINYLEDGHLWIQFFWDEDNYYVKFSSERNLKEIKNENNNR